MWGKEGNPGVVWQGHDLKCKDVCWYQLLITLCFYHCNGQFSLKWSDRQHRSPWWMSYGVPSQIAKFMGSTWGPPGSCRPQMCPVLGPWTLLSGFCEFNIRLQYNILSYWLRLAQPYIEKKPWGNSITKRPSFHYRYPHYKDKMVSLPSCLYNGNPNTKEDGLHVERRPYFVMLSWSYYMPYCVNGDHVMMRPALYKPLYLHSNILEIQHIGTKLLMREGFITLRWKGRYIKLQHCCGWGPV